MIQYRLESCDYHVTTVCRDVDETKSWMNEKDTALLSDDYGRDLASVQALQRKHEGLERDLAALEDKVRLILRSLASFPGSESTSQTFISSGGPPEARSCSDDRGTAVCSESHSREGERGSGCLDQPQVARKSAEMTICCTF